MAGTYFKMDFTKVASKLNTATNHIKDTKSLMETVGETLVSGAKERFEAETSPAGKAWQPLKNRQGKILDDVGDLKRSISFNATVTDVMYGTNKEYGATHQFGRGDIPARPFIGVSKGDEDELKHMLMLHIEDSFK